MEIRKYSTALGTSVTIDMPKGSDIVHADIAGNWLTVWAEVDDDAPLVERLFQLVITGETLWEGVEHVATVTQGVHPEGVHVYDAGEIHDGPEVL